jgi:regulatory protein YycI of two-component signal transduction system YycFG
MQWGQIKTLFILCFLLLDIYLLFLVIQKQSNEDLPFKETEELREQEQELEIENIKIPDDLPESLPDEAYVTVKQKVFTEEEIEQIKSLENQDIQIVNNSFIIGKFKKTIAIPENATKEDIAKLVSSALYLGNEYELEYWDEEKNVLIFFQMENDRPVYYNQNGMIMVYLNENSEMIAYTQSFLGEPEGINDKKTIITPLKAIYTLYENRLLLSYDEVTDVQMGYHSMLPLESGTQVLVPTWKITINDSKERFVNAAQRYVVKVNDEFENSVFEMSIDNLATMKGKNEFKESMLKIIEERLGDNRSEAE